MSKTSTKIRNLVDDPSVSYRYGSWGILSPIQRRQIRALCDLCDMFEQTADSLAKEVERLMRKEQSVSIVCDKAMEHYHALYEDAKEILKAEARAEAIKEFAERLRSHYPHTNSILKRIDCIEKEMIEEAKK